MSEAGGRGPIIQLEDIHRVYRLGEVDLHVLKGVSLTIERGEMVALMGASGSGKSTLMNVLGCLDRPTRGRYILDGEDVTDATPDRRAELRSRLLGFVFQSFNLLARTTALEQVIMPTTYAHRAVGEGDARRRAEGLLRRVGLGDRMDHVPSQLSGGQQQRVAIARALVNDPKVLFADEPTGNLDSKTSEEILGMFRDLNKNEGLTVVLVTHEADVAAHADRAIRIRDGLIEAGAFDAAGADAAGKGAGR